MILTLRSQHNSDITVARCQYLAVAENRRTSRVLARRLSARPTADSTMLAAGSGCGKPYLEYQCCWKREKIGVKGSPNIQETRILHAVRAGMSRRLVIGAISAASNGDIWAQDCRAEFSTAVWSMTICNLSKKHQDTLKPKYYQWTTLWKSSVFKFLGWPIHTCQLYICACHNNHALATRLCFYCVEFGPEGVMVSRWNFGTTFWSRHVTRFWQWPLPKLSRSCSSHFSPPSIILPRNCIYRAYHTC